MIQAVFFGDGGILAIGANCFNMAVAIPYIAHAIYHGFAGNSAPSSTRRPIGAALGGWTGMTAGAFLTAIEFGIQPILFHTPDGAPLYAPFPLSISLPAMVIPHILVASVIEGLLTAMVIASLQRSNSPILTASGASAVGGAAGGHARPRWLWLGLIVLIVASPLGLLAPGTAWGEWGTEELGQMGLGTIPHGLQSLSQLWGAPLAEYEIPWLGSASVGYVLSAVVGVLAVATVAWLFVNLAVRFAGTPKRTG
jgi:cobalt/nickel transport system permease protein